MNLTKNSEVRASLLDSVFPECFRVKGIPSDRTFHPQAPHSKYERSGNLANETILIKRANKLNYMELKNQKCY